MSKPFVVLQLSDIHRTSDDPVSNADLLAALASDRNRWPSDAATGPDLVVVSGDLVQGVSLGATDADKQLAAQYEDASGLLIEICDRFLDGDRSRLVLVPGNHDVDWVTARQSMQLASVAELEKVAAKLPGLALDPESDYRWSWRERALYKIVDRPLYETRLNRFLTFRRDFYAGVSPDPLALDDDLVFMEFPHLDISVTGLSSWYGNDCYNYVGAFNSKHLLSARDAISESPCGLHVAVWHHGVRGGPSDADYMDPRAVHKLIDHGFRVGLHGHHHRSEASVMQVRLPSSEEFALLSTGSLAAGGHQLPAGVERQYSVLCFDPASRSVRSHIRESTTGLVFVPGSRPDLGGESSLQVNWSQTPRLPGRAVVLVKTLDDAFAAHGRRDWATAWALLQEVPTLPPAGRRLAVDIAVELNAWQELIDLLGPPQSQDELVALVDAHLRMSSPLSASDVLNGYAAALGMAPANQAELRARIEVKGGHA